MTKTSLLAAGLAVSATSVFAGGMDRSGQSIAPIFENGTYAQLTFGTVDPSVTGSLADVLSSGDVATSYNMVGLAYKSDLNDKLSFAILLDQPFGASVDYGNADEGYPFKDATAAVDTKAITAVLRYKLSDRIGIHGGVRALKSHGEVSLPSIEMSEGTLPEYTLDTSNETDFSYLIGASYEIPDIALRAAITYSSKTTIDFVTTESTAGNQSLEVIMPESINFDFQTGIAADTLLLASARYVKWSETVIAPVGYPISLVDYDDDTVTYSLGIGRRLSDKLSASVSYGYEKSAGTPVGNLGPTDGLKSITIGARYSITDQTALSAGASYVWVGDATTTIGADFTDNSAIGFGLKLSHSF